MKKLLTVAIGIAAYNERKNIGNLLKSLLLQKCRSFHLKQIIVISDGSSDGTESAARAFSDRRVLVIAGVKRLGQAARINQIFRIHEADVLVLIDGDMVLRDANVLEKFVQQFVADKRVGFVTGNTLPLPARTFLEQAINNYVIGRDVLHRVFDFGKTLYAAHAFMGYSWKFLRSFRLPDEILNPDAFSFVACIVSGYKHRHARGAVAYYRSVSTVSDHLRQAVRHRRGGDQLYDYFDRALVDKYWRIPLEVRLWLLRYQMNASILGYIFLKILNTYCAAMIKLERKHIYGLWEPSATSKSLV